MSNRVSMRQAFRIMVCLFAWGAASGVLWAADAGDAGQPGAFLNYGVGARGLGMGRAFVGLADDATAVYWNPAGLALTKQNQAIVQYGRLIDGNGFHYLGYSHIFPYIGTMGVGMVYLDQGEAEGRNTYNEVTGNFTNTQLGFLLGFGTDITSQLTVGTTVKVINQRMMEVSGTGIGLDLGLVYYPWNFLNLGLNFQNLLAPAIRLKEYEERYPMNMTFGIAVKLLNDMVKADLDVAKNMEQSAVKPRFGVEVCPMQELFVRAGLDDTEIGLGAGYRYQGFQLDYALSLLTPEIMHKVSLSYYFGGFVLEVKADPETFSPVGINRVSIMRMKCQTKFQVRSWKLEIYNEAAALVKKYNGDGIPPDHIAWDGLLDNTNAMPDGKYKVVFTVEDVSGAKNTVETKVNILSLLPLGISPVELN